MTIECKRGVILIKDIEVFKDVYLELSDEMQAKCLDDSRSCASSTYTSSSLMRIAPRLHSDIIADGTTHFDSLQPQSIDSRPGKKRALAADLDSGNTLDLSNRVGPGHKSAKLSLAVR